MMLLEVDQLVLPLDIFPGNRTPSLTLNLIRLHMKPNLEFNRL